MFAARQVPYHQTNAFSRIVLDYLSGDPGLTPFYAVAPSRKNVETLIERKKRQPLRRDILVSVLKDQYASLKASEKTLRNIDALLSDTTFTITTAHQPNLFTGPLYFIYKILHAIRLAETLSRDIPSCHFVPVYYMGSEDADFAELNHTYVSGKKIEWNKQQSGAVGRMKVDASLQQLIAELEGQLTVLPFGSEVIRMLRQAYAQGRTIQEATFELVNELYGKYGLVVLIPDNPALKQQMLPVFEAELTRQAALPIVEESSKNLEQHYEAQAHAREINLFYLKDQVRERIEKKGGEYHVVNTQMVFSSDEILAELKSHPERFSPNVILRGLYQETILPDIAFVGGGGELAYWLQLRPLFDHYGVVYPMLVLRNSFLIIENKWLDTINKLGLDVTDLFQTENDLMKQIIKKQSVNKVSLNGNFEQAESLFGQIETQATAIDPTLKQHVAAIRTKALKTLQELEKKMLRAEKRKFSTQQQQLKKLREALFPNGGLQERVENFSSFYALWGPAFIDALYRHSLSFEQEFTVLTESPGS